MKFIAVGILGFLSIAIGAVGEHALRGSAGPEIIRSFEVAIRYHQLHSVALLALAIGIAANDRLAPLAKAFWLMFEGTVLFSFSIYASVFTGIKALTYITPLGGITLMLSWLMVALLAKMLKLGVVDREITSQH